MLTWDDARQHYFFYFFGQDQNYARKIYNKHHENMPI